MGRIEVLDVTLRDGGCVNDFNFGQDYMERILYAQEEAGIDIIELGYLDNAAGTACGRTKYIDEKVIYHSLLKQKKTGRTYVAMMDYGKFDVEKLERKNKNSIDGIRLAFHKKDRMEAIKLGRMILDKGYMLYIQPMITLRYSDRELLDLIEYVNSELSEITAFYIVDSFGEMRANDVDRIWNIVNHNLKPNIKIGFHSHNNLQLSYSNAMEIMQIAAKRDIILDSSIMGMGKGAGNLNTELLLEHLNFYRDARYRIDPLLEVMDKVVNQLHAEWGWGYAPEYYLSAINQCTPSYASYFYSRHMLSIDQINELLRRIDEQKKISFDPDYAEKLYREYNEEKAIDDNASVKKIAKQLTGKQILLVAPGKSVEMYLDRIKEYENMSDIAIMGLNTPIDIKFEYVITTREDIYRKLKQAGKQVIVPSNISKDDCVNVSVLNYSDWIIYDGELRDSSLVIALKLLNRCHIKKIYMVGFDGFSVNMNDNYYDPYLRHPLKEEQVKDYNRFYGELIAEYKNKGIEIVFMTQSRYEQMG